MDFNFKRPADPPTEPAPKKFKATGTPATVDLNYPFWYTNSDNGGGGGGGGPNPPIVPPFVDPNGPLVDNSGLLSIRLQKPIVAVGAVGNKAVTVLTDNTLGLNDSYQLGLKVAPNGGIIAEQDGLKIDVDQGAGLTLGVDGLGVSVDDLSLEIDPDFNLSVKLDPTGPLSESRNGIMLITDSTLTIDPSDENPDQYELGVKLSTHGPINADAEGLDLDYDQQTLTLESASGAEGHLALTVKLDETMRKTDAGIGINKSIIPEPSPSGPLAIRGQNELILSIDNTLAVNESKQLTVVGGGSSSITVTPPISNTDNNISLMIDPRSILGRDTAGLTALINNNDFTNHTTQGLSLLTPIKYLSPYCIMTSGDVNLPPTISEVISSTRAQKWKCGYYLQMVNSSGIVNGSINILLDKARMATDPPSYNNLEFAFALGFNPSDQDVQYCTLINTEYVPNETAASFFVPKTLGSSLHDLAIQPQALNWFMSYTTSGSLTTFKPSTYPAETLYTRDSIMNFSVRRLASGTRSNVLFFSFFLQLPNVFTNYESVCTTPLTFSYVAIDKPSFLGLGSQS